MMRLLNILICIIYFTANAVSQDANAFDKVVFKTNKIKMQTVLEHDYVKGNPANAGKKIQDNFYDVVGNKIQEINYRFNGSVHSIITYKYDNKGNKIEYIKYDGNKEKLVFRQFFQYDNNGNVSLESGFNGVENYKTVFKYNDSKRITEVIYYLDNKVDEKRFFSYINKTSEISVMDATLKLTYKINYTYDDKGRVTSEIKIEDATQTKKVMYAYDARGNQTSEEKSIRGKFTSRITRVYDANNHLIEVYNESPEQKYLAQKYTYSNVGLLVEEAYRNSATKEFSKNTYIYQDNGVCKSMDSYYASYNEQVMYVYNYEKY